MGFSDVLELFRDPAAQTIIGLVIAVVVGIWTVFTYCRRSRESGKPTQSVRADHGGVAAGRDAVVVNRSQEKPSD